jgi:hypothetical protein
VTHTLLRKKESLRLSVKRNGRIRGSSKCSQGGVVMPTTIDFYARDSNADGPFYRATLVINAEGKTTITGDQNTREFLQEDIREGFPVGPFGEERMFPSDSEEYVQRLLGRYSGSRFWARIREEGDRDPSVDPEAATRKR